MAIPGKFEHFIVEDDLGIRTKKSLAKKKVRVARNVPKSNLKTAKMDHFFAHNSKTYGDPRLNFGYVVGENQSFRIKKRLSKKKVRVAS